MLSFVYNIQMDNMLVHLTNVAIQKQGVIESDESAF